jgi:hypothetical protein
MIDVVQLKALRLENMPPVSFFTVVLIAPGGQTFMFSFAVEIADPTWQDGAPGSPFRTRDEVRSVRVNHAKLRTFATHIVTEMTSAANLVPTMEVTVAIEKDAFLPLATAGFTIINPAKWGAHLEDGPGPSGIRARMADYPCILSYGVMSITVRHNVTLPSSSLLRHVHMDALEPDCRANDHAIGVYCLLADEDPDMDFVECAFAAR